MIDAHVHVMPGDPDILLQRLLAHGAQAFNVLGVPTLWGQDNNLRSLHFKNLRPGATWAFGGLHWQGKVCPQPEKQLELLIAAGFDGLKLLETKPDMQKDLGFLPDDQAFDAMFALAEEKHIPILWHVGDPAPFWHLDQAPQFAVENGWTYEGEGFLSLNELYERTERVLERHPNLRVILAHLYFCSDDMTHLMRLFERFPQVHIDITPGIEMYHNFAKDRDKWQDFFQKYSHRILLGSDTTNDPGEGSWGNLAALTRLILKDEDFEIWDIAMRGFSLSPAQFEAITRGNFTRLAGKAPKPINPEGLQQMLAFLKAHLSADSYTDIKNAYEEWFT